MLKKTMIKTAIFGFLLSCNTFYFADLALAQNTQKPVQLQKDEEPVVVINTDLVQIDVIVTDKKGHPVSNLKAEDFIISENETDQEITNFSYVDLNQTNKSLSGVKSNNSNIYSSSATPAKPLRFRDFRRTFVILIDDAGLTVDSAEYTRSKLKDFINKQLQPTDLVTILHTGGSNVVLQPFTNDKERLTTAIKEFGTINSREELLSTPAISTSVNISSMSTVPTGATPDLEPPLDNRLIHASLSRSLRILSNIVTNLNKVPGRKSLLFISDGFPTNPKEKLSNPYNSILSNIAEQANRGSITIHTVDGVPTKVAGVLQAGDDVAFSENFGDSSTTSQQQGVLNALNTPFVNDSFRRQGLNYLSSHTGGTFSLGMDGGLAGITRDQQGYYLIGYSPKEDIFKGNLTSRSFRKLSVKVKNPKLIVRTRLGFYAATDSEVLTTSKNSKTSHF